MLTINANDIQGIVSRNAGQLGMELQARRRVLNVEVDGDKVTASVQGSEPAPYRQKITVAATKSGRPLIHGICTCPVGANCKHVAAVLFELIRRRPQPANGTPPPRRLVQATVPLPPEVEAWLRALQTASVEDPEAYPPTVRKRMLYLLDSPVPGALRVAPVGIELLRDGGVSPNVTYHDPEPLLGQYGAMPKFVRPSDRAILRGLHHDTDSEDFIGTLRRIIATGRGRWRAVDGPVLSEAEPKPAQLTWRLLDDGRQSPALDLPPGLLPLHLHAPWYIEPATGRLGPLETALPSRLASAVLAGPPLAPDSAARVGAELARLLPTANVPAPRELAPAKRISAKARPRLELFAADLPFDPYAHSWGWARSPETLEVPLARLGFHYGPALISPSLTTPTVMHGGELLSVTRDRKAEAAAWRALRDFGLGPLRLPAHATDTHLRDTLMPVVPDHGESWIEFLMDGLPVLREAGWDIVIADDFPLRIIEPDGPIAAELRESSGIDWLDLDLGVMVDGARVDLIPVLLGLLESGELGALLGAETDDEAAANILIRLPDGRMLATPVAQLRPIVLPLLELFAGRLGAEDGAIRLSRMDAAELADLEGASANAGVAWSGGDAVRALGRQLRGTEGIPRIAVPESFTATLRPYQERGVDWMGFLRAAELGGVLADDMGLGKTVQALAHFAVEQSAGRLDRPALVICPTSLIPNWRAEAARFAPTLRVLVLHGPDRARLFPEIPAHDLVITTYPLLSRDHETLAAQEWHVVALDEAQTIKNPAATTSKLARQLQARQRLCLSGTPLENHLGELWSLFDFLMPGFLGNRKDFARRYRTPIEKGGNTALQASLARRVAPFLLRRTKAEVAADLPPKTEIAEPVEMEEPQRAVYEAIRLAMHAKVQAAVAAQGLARSGIVILDALLKLRQACCDPRLLKLGTANAAKASSAKLDRLMEMLPTMLEEGRSILLFSQFTSMLALIEAELAKLSLPYVMLTGDTRDRAAPVERFQSGEAKLFLISLKAGGTGLNLTAADTVIHYDPWWNPAVEDQATDRAHRIGQDKPVFVHRLITRDSIEEKMEVLKARKQALVAGILDTGPGTTLGITEEDLRELLG